MVVVGVVLKGNQARILALSGKQDDHSVIASKVTKLVKEFYLRFE